MADMPVSVTGDLAVVRVRIPLWALKTVDPIYKEYARLLKNKRKEQTCQKNGAHTTKKLESYLKKN